APLRRRGGAIGRVEACRGERGEKRKRGAVEVEDEGAREGRLRRGGGIMARHRRIACIVPPHIFQKLLESRDRRLRELALNNMLSATQLRTQRTVLGLLSLGPSAGGKRRTIYDAKGRETTPPRGTRVRGEGDAPTTDGSVNEAYDGLGKTYDF